MLPIIVLTIHDGFIERNQRNAVKQDGIYLVSAIASEETRLLYSKQHIGRIILSLSHNRYKTSQCSFAANLFSKHIIVNSRFEWIS
jgi:hypothetical protein